MAYDRMDLLLLGPYCEWRQDVESLEDVRRYARLLNNGYGYNYRLWVRGPLLRVVGDIDTTRTNQITSPPFTLPGVYEFDPVTMQPTSHLKQFRAH